ncbi:MULTISPECIES: GNAT family N-acetyltransferase [Nocardiopsis]|uniref:GNAT family N-acetyltransferase n=1 Tax=Nocardiopsis sinuspersici TaxID=501010 RepID=A0A1V3C390_9ACTN|nr:MULTISPECIES: GNAT family N-acetyltransferase [Nocardiopsis]NYH51650.1 ribosomal protein S18 acetylase RimI-like enzyme [Nocardiopsis sinuspersici]OOC55264.1 GNAT family N-acetyltransferase [Nocardiopsis sinuspersici]
MIRPARPDDVPVIHAMIGELAEYEKEPDAVVATEQDLRTALFGPEPAVFAHVAEHDGDEGTAVVGFSLWFRSYSTWTGRHGIHLEDLYVRPESRGRGHGLALLRTLARICVERGYTRLEWSVLDWNEPSIRFYESLGSQPMDGWTVRRLDGEALAVLGAGRN